MFFFIFIFYEFFWNLIVRIYQIDNLQVHIKIFFCNFAGLIMNLFLLNKANIKLSDSLHTRTPFELTTFPSRIIPFLYQSNLFLFQHISSPFPLISFLFQLPPFSFGHLVFLFLVFPILFQSITFTFPLQPPLFL